MRITKVKVKGDNRMVLMHRNAQEGSLIFEGNPNVDESKHILPSKKMDSFQLSIINKTLVKTIVVPRCPQCIDAKNLCAECQAEIKRVKSYKRPLSEIISALVKGEAVSFPFKKPFRADKEAVLLCLNQKFQQGVTYQKNGITVSFDLATLLVSYAATKNYNCLQPYREWVKWYIETKTGNILLSINKNRIVTDDAGTLSKKKLALNEWAETYISHGAIDLARFHNKYRINELADRLNSLFADTDKKKLLEDRFSFHRSVKQTLQSHQKEIFSAQANEEYLQNRADTKLSAYHLEVVKYLEHFFPIKKSKRRNSLVTMAYYLRADTIKSTIQQQLENAIRTELLRRGKIEHHAEIKEVTSTTLSVIKRREAFVLNLLDACAFAANNLRNIVDTEQSDDIVGAEKFEQSLKTNRVNRKLFELFYGVPLQEDDKTLWALRGSIQGIRNNIVHYKKNGVDDVFSLDKFEYPRRTSEKSYTDTIFKQCLTDAIGDIPLAIAEQLKSGGVLAYYAFEDVKSLLEKCKFSLCRSSLAFTPGYKKVAAHGHGYQYSDAAYNLQLSYYIDKKSYQGREEAYQAHYFLLKLIYNNMFLTQFTNNRAAFTKAVKFVRETNRKNAANTRNKNAFAFNDVRDISDGESLGEYMSYVQSRLIDEKDKKDDHSSGKVCLNFEKFLLQVFVKGFDNYLTENKLIFVKKPEIQFAATMTDNDKAAALNVLEKQIVTVCQTVKPYSINADRGSHIAFYVFCKLLDANYLSELRNELIKYRQTGTFELNHALEIIELCLLSSDRVPAQWESHSESRSEYLSRIVPFVEQGADVSTWGDLYVQQDNATPVVHKTIALLHKYGTAKLLQEVAKDHPLTKREYDEWSAMSARIAEVTKQREKLHEEWVEIERKNKKKKDQKLLFTKHETYKKLCDQIDRYNWLDNKLHLVHLRRLHDLTIDMVGRMVGFVALWDRDFILFDAARSDDAFCLTEAMSFRDIRKDKVVKRDGTPMTEADRAELDRCMEKKRERYMSAFFMGNEKVYGDRNYIAHFGYLNKTGSRSLIELINRLRHMMQYDRKLKNAVVKSIVTIFDKHGMSLKFKLNDQHELELDTVKPKEITHLFVKGGKEKSQITTDQVSPEYCALCASLLEFKKRE